MTRSFSSAGTHVHHFFLQGFRHGTLAAELDERGDAVAQQLGNR